MIGIRALSLAILLLGTATRAVDLFVAPTGNDAWAGRTATVDGTKGPFASLARARDEIRALKKGDGLGTGVTVHVRGGSYALAKTLRLDAADAGTANAPIVYRGFAAERPSLVGGCAISNFVVDTGSILRADLQAAGLKGVKFQQLLFGGERQHLARYPNFDPANPYGGGWAYADGTPIPMYKDIEGESRRTFTYRTNDATAWTTSTGGELFVFPRYNWWNNLVPIATIDPTQRLVTLKADCSYPIRPGDRYYVRNVRAELDAPGEWYLDLAAGQLHFWPPAPLAGRAVLVPTLRTLLELAPGTAHVTFRGFTFECSEGTAIVLNNTTNCLIAANVIRNVGDYNGAGVSVSGGKGNGVAGNDIHATGSHGISIGGGDRISLTPAGNYADNNYLHHIGVFNKHGVGVLLNGCGNRAAHNLIHDGPRMGIQFSGNNLLIEYNHIRHVNLETEDTGAVYTGGRDWISSRGSVIRHNYFHDMLGFGQKNGKWVSPHFAWGVYLDDNAGGVDVIGNIVARCSRAGIHLHNGRDNRIVNNIFIDHAQKQIEYSGWTSSHRYWTNHFATMERGYASVKDQPSWRGMRHMDLAPSNAVLPDKTIMRGNEFTRNIVVSRQTNQLYARFANYSHAHNLCDSNLVWSTAGAVKTGILGFGPDRSSNLIARGDFEGMTAGKMPEGWWWQARPSNAVAAVATITDTVARTCFCVGAAVSKSSDGKVVRPSLGGFRVPAKPGQGYRLAMNVKATRPGATATISGQSHVSGVYFWSAASNLNVGLEWERREVTFQFPAPGRPGWNDRMSNVEVSVSFADAEGALLVDDVALTEADGLDAWLAWQSLGADRHSIVADPLFVDAEKDDYRLKPESPALRMDFEPIPVEKIGPYADPLRASWPIIEAEGAREKPLTTGEAP